MRLKKKILLGITKATWGGAQRYVFDLATSFRGEYEVAVMGGEAGMLAGKLKADGIPFIELPGLGRDIRWLGELRHLIQIWQVIRREKPDILHLSSPKMAGLGAFCGRVFGVPHIIVTVHGWYFREDRGWLAKAAIVFFSWLISAFAHRTIVINKNDLATARKFIFIRRKKFILVRNGIETNTAFIAKEEARRSILEKSRPRLNPDSQTLWLGSIAELIPNKDIGTMIEAIGFLKCNANLFIIGRGPQEEELTKKIKMLGLDNRVAFVELAPPAARVLPAFDIFLLSSIKEGLPYVLLEAGLAGIPVIATDIPGNRDIIEDQKTGLLFPPKSPEELARAIQNLTGSETLRPVLAENLRKKVRSDFPIERMIGETRRIYGLQ